MDYSLLQVNGQLLQYIITIYYYCHIVNYNQIVSHNQIVNHNYIVSLYNILNIPGVVQDRDENNLLMHIGKALLCRKREFVSIALYILVNNILAFGSVVFCCRAASLGKAKNFTDKTVHLFLASSKVFYFLSQVHKKKTQTTKFSLGKY